MIRTLLAPNPSPMTLDGTRTFLVGRERPAVIDPGPANPSHLDAVLTALDGNRPVAILLTHAHPDHADAAPELARRTGAPVMMARGAAGPRLFDGAVRWIGERDRVQTDAGVLRVVQTPGHAPEHVVFLLDANGGEGDRALFAGDLFMGGADTTLVAPPEGDLTEYLRSLDRVQALNPSAIHPAHGPAIDEPLAAIQRYRAHRAERIAQVERALAAGPARPGELIDRVYGAELHPALRGAAEGSLRAILYHLRSTGRVRDEAGRFSLASG
ncbi:MAG: MBL fold metallo-hydrolase [Gemmatimonadetes bacterium]|nr:MBL fold metallo-hydrolase [Gemmatimonadota bacterium]